MTMTPREIDAHVSRRIRELREWRGLSLQTLADAIGVSHQQLQKYEKGDNRISVAKLYQLGIVLDVELSAFFDGMAYFGPNGGDAPDGEPSPEGDAPPTRELITLSTYYRCIRHAQQRSYLYKLARMWATDDGTPEAQSESER